MWRPDRLIILAAVCTACGSPASESPQSSALSHAPLATVDVAEPSDPRTWLAAVRPEGLPRPNVELQPDAGNCNPAGGGRSLVHVDALGELGPEAPAWVDLTCVMVRTESLIPFAEGVGAWIEYDVLAGPTEPAAYGIVIDVDHDGTGDYMLGIDNSTPAPLSHAEWIAELATSTVSVSEDPRAFGHEAFSTRVEGWYPGDGPNLLFFASRHVPGEGSLRFYFWAASVSDGRLLTDYAPNTDWINFVPTDEPEL